MIAIPKIWRFLRENGAQITLISGIFVTLFAVLEYCSKQKEIKVERSLAYISTAIGRDILAARVDTVLFSMRSPLKELINSDKLWLGVNCNSPNTSVCKPNSEARDEINKIIDRKENEGIKVEIHDLLNVYYSFATCAVSGLCNNDVLCAAFFAEAQEFYQYYGNIATTEANGWNGYKIKQIGEFLKICDRDWVSSTLPDEKKD